MWVTTAETAHRHRAGSRTAALDASPSANRQTPSRVLALQRLVGNRATRTLLQRDEPGVPDAGAAPTSMPVEQATTPAHRATLEAEGAGTGVIAKVDRIPVARIGLTSETGPGHIAVDVNASGITVIVTHDGSATVTALVDHAAGLPVRIQERVLPAAGVHDDRGPSLLDRLSATVRRARAAAFPDPYGDTRNTYGAYGWQSYAVSENSLVYGPGYTRDRFGRMSYAGPVDPSGMPPPPLPLEEFARIRTVPQSAFTTWKSEPSAFEAWQADPDKTVKEANAADYERRMLEECASREELPALLIGEGAGRFLGAESTIAGERGLYHAGTEAISDAAVEMAAREMTTEELREAALKVTVMRRSLVGRVRNAMYDQELVGKLAARDAAEYGPGGRTFDNLFKKYYRLADGATENARLRDTYTRIIGAGGRSNRLANFIAAMAQLEAHTEALRSHAISVFFEDLPEWMDHDRRKAAHEGN